MGLIGRVGLRRKQETIQKSRPAAFVNHFVVVGLAVIEFWLAQLIRNIDGVVDGIGFVDGLLI